ncbi:MAG: DUF2149 domain-containing protein [Gemmataceae bacterium]|nr:DUF2149 domain-containing protein [Gemmataceae bacterium]
MRSASTPRHHLLLAVRPPGRGHRGRRPLPPRPGHRRRVEGRARGASWPGTPSTRRCPAACRLSDLVSSQDEVTVIKNPGTPDMQIIRKKSTEIETLKPTGSRSTGEGQKLGTAYKLKSGNIVLFRRVGE